MALQAIGGLVAVGSAAPYGLVPIAAMSLFCAVAIALAGLWPLGRRPGRERGRRGGMATPLAGALATGAVMFLLAEPVGLALAPLPALCLLGACGRLCSLVVSGVAGGGRRMVVLRRAKPA